MQQQAKRILQKILHHTQGIPLIVYKGIDLVINYYPKTESRSFIDIDLCVRRQDYHSVKEKISKIPGIFLISNETRLGPLFYGHALYLDTASGLYVEIHVSKNPRTVLEYILNKEHTAFFNKLKKIPLGKYHYYSLSPSEYLQLLFRQLLKRFSLGQTFFTQESLSQLMRDAALITTKISAADWSRLNTFFTKKTIMMRLRLYHNDRSWLFFLRLIQESTKERTIPKKTITKLQNQLQLPDVKKITLLLSELQNKKDINLRGFLEKPSIHLFIIRIIIGLFQNNALKKRRPLRAL